MYCYVPILRWKKGERRGLNNLQSDAKTDVVPLFQLQPEQFKAPTGARSASVSPAQHFVAQVLADWGTSPFYLDASALPQGIGTAHHPLIDIAAAARVAGIHLIPATSLGVKPSYQTAVVAINSADNRGAALRVDLSEFSSASSWVAGLSLPLSQLDLIADLKTSIGVASALGTALITTFATLHGGASWRTVTIAGTSIPDDFSGYSAGLHTIKRIEWSLWSKLVTAGLPYRLDYGDYATVSLAAPPSGIAWGYPINVKYTLKNEFLICRGIKTTGKGGVDMAPQLISHAKKIKGHSGRGPITGCWADDQIDKVASGTQSCGSLETWVRYGVNRHIERVRLDLP